MLSASSVMSTGRRSSQKRRQIAPSLIIGSPQPRTATRSRAISAVIASQSPALTNSAVKTDELLRRHRNFRDQTYAVSMFPLHIAMLVVYIVMVGDVSPPDRILPVQQGIHSSFVAPPSVHYDGTTTYYGHHEISSQDEWWTFLGNFVETMFPECDSNGAETFESCRSEDFSKSGDVEERTYNGGLISRRDPTHSNRVLYGVLVRQERSGPYKDCQVTDGIPFDRKLTHAINYCKGNGEATLDKLSFDRTFGKPAWTTKDEGYFFHSDVQETDDGTDKPAMGMNKESGFWLPERLGALNGAIVSNYSQSSWMSASNTEEVVIEWVSYNAENSVLAHTTLTTSFSSSGVSSSYNIVGLVVDYSEAGSASQAVCFTLGAIMLLAFLYRAFKTWSHRGWKAMVSRCTEFDLFVDCVNASSLIISVLLCYWVNEALSTVVKRYDAGFYDDHDNDTGSYAEDRALSIMRYLTSVVEYRILVFKIFSMLGFITQLLQFVKICTFHPQLDVLVKTVMVLVTSGVFFFALFILALFFFAITGNSLFGDKLETFNSLGTSLHTLCNVLMTADGLEYDGLDDSRTYLLLFFYYSFILIMSIIFMNLVLAIVVEAYDKMREDADRETSLSAMQVLMDLKVQFHEFLDTMDDGHINSVRETRSHRNICWVLTTPQEKGGLKGRTRLNTGDLEKALCISHEGATRLISEIKVEKLPSRSRTILDLAADSNGDELDVILPALEQLRDERLASEASRSLDLEGQQNSSVERRTSPAPRFSNSANRVRARYSAPDNESAEFGSSSLNRSSSSSSSISSSGLQMIPSQSFEEQKDDNVTPRIDEEHEYPPLATPVPQSADLTDDFAPVSIINPDDEFHRSQDSALSFVVAEHNKRNGNGGDGDGGDDEDPEDPES